MKKNHDGVGSWDSIQPDQDQKTAGMLDMQTRAEKQSLRNPNYCAFQKTCQSRNKHKISAVTCAGHISRTGHSIVLISFVTSLHISTAGPGTLKFYDFFTYSISTNLASKPIPWCRVCRNRICKEIIKFESARPCSRYMQACYKEIRTIEWPVLEIWPAQVTALILCLFLLWQVFWKGVIIPKVFVKFRFKFYIWHTSSLFFSCACENTIPRPF